MDPQAKVEEDRLRRVLQRRGLTLEKNRRKDPGAIGYGKHQVLNARGAVIGGKGFTLDIEALDAWVKAYDRENKE